MASAMWHLAKCYSCMILILQMGKLRQRRSWAIWSVTQWYRIKLGINFREGLAHQPVSTGQVKNVFAGVRVYCINKTVCVVEIKYWEEVGREPTHRTTCFTQHTPASSVWVLKRKKMKEDKFNTSLMKINGEICLWLDNPAQSSDCFKRNFGLFLTLLFPFHRASLC